MRISKYLPDIILKLSKVPILFLIAPTGSGKSLAFPAAIASIGSRVFVSVPTRTSVHYLTNTQKIILPNIDVGYAAEADIFFDVIKNIDDEQPRAVEGGRRGVVQRRRRL